MVTPLTSQVSGGHLIKYLDNSANSSTLKGISVQLLHIIAHKAGLSQLCGNIQNAYVNAYTNEKVWTRVGPKFGVREGQVIIIMQDPYGLRTSAQRFHARLADTLPLVSHRLVLIGMFGSKCLKTRNAMSKSVQWSMTL